MPKQEKIVIIGAGLSGSLLALRLAQRGYRVKMYESRPDLRKTNISAGKSINLALSDRGFKALRMAGVEEKAREICIPMYGRLVHDVEGKTFPSNYSGREGEYINSISRGDLNALLLDEAEKHENVEVFFNQRCTGVDLDSNTALFKSEGIEEETKIFGDIVFGTDGAGSALRKSYFLKHKFLFSFSQEFLSHGYKELEIPALEGCHQISKDYLHIWPRGEYMLIALANLNGSFTVTLFLGHDEGEYNFENLDTEERIKQFFTEQFPDALALIPNIAEEFANNPTGVLGTIKCSPWSYKGKTLILGDAAHAVVPFYGQGMNASFEDVYVLDQVLNEYEGDWKKVFDVYEKRRKEDADAIGALAIENYYEMRDHVANPIFKEKRKVEMVLEKTFPKRYFSKYSMVTFNENIRYFHAMKKGNAQDQVLLKMVGLGVLKNIDKMNEQQLEKLLNKIEKKTENFLNQNTILKSNKI